MHHMHIIHTRRHFYRDWIFALSFIVLAGCTYMLEKRIESSMQTVEIDYN